MKPAFIFNISLT